MRVKDTQVTMKPVMGEGRREGQTVGKEVKYSWSHLAASTWASTGTTFKIFQNKCFRKSEPVELCTRVSCVH